MARVQDDFRRAVPPGDDVFGQSRRGLLVASSQAEVADLQVTVLVQQKVRWLKVAMDDVRRVHIIGALENLMHKVLHVVVREILARVDDSVHVGLHQLRDDIDVFKACTLRGLLDIN